MAPGSAGAADSHAKLLCAAAHLRPDRAEEIAEKLKTWRQKKAKEFGEKVTPPKSMRERGRQHAAKRADAKEKTALGRLKNLDEDEPAKTKQPRVLVGHEYVCWVRRRITGSGRPVPSQGFDLEAVLTTCGPVSLREIYSTRYMEHMFQYDDARRYIEMMQKRVFPAVEGFSR